MSNGIVASSSIGTIFYDVLSYTMIVFICLGRLVISVSFLVCNCLSLAWTKQSCIDFEFLTS